jgi:hypothetical protein
MMYLTGAAIPAFQVSTVSQAGPGSLDGAFAGNAFGYSMSLIEVLKRCRELTQASQDAMWSSSGVAGIVAILDCGIHSLECGTEPNRDELRLLFAPTGDLQETSMANGWSSEYLLLTSEFDRLIR